MANIALVTADTLHVVESIIQMTLPAAEAITAGQAVRIDTTSGKFTLAKGTEAGEARIYGIAVKTTAAGMPVTAIRKGVLEGYNLSGDAYDAPVYLSDTDGTLAQGNGTVTVVVGRVIPATAAALGAAYDKLLFVDL